jgi:hypothetical protein
MNILRNTIVLFCILALNPMAFGFIVHGNFPGDTVDFMMVTETNDSEPDLFWDITGVVGDTLLVNPTDFRVDVATGPGSDFLDSQLETMIQTNSGGSISNIRFSEFGDYFLAGDSSVSASLNWFVQIPGSGTAAGTIQFTDSNPMANLVTDTWVLDLDIDLVAGTANGAPLTDISTGQPLVLPAEIPKVTFEFNNTLFASAADNLSTGFIAKKGTSGISAAVVPEPAALTLALSMFGLAVLALRSRKKG